MRVIKTVLPLIFILTGCPGGNPASKPRATFIDGNHLCFSVDKKDSLNYYSIDYYENGNIKSMVSSGNKKPLLFYPESCINVKWQYGYSYVIHYGLNDKKYVHQFVIDKYGRLTNLGGL